MMKDKLILYNDYSIINKKCFNCSSYAHSVNYCSRIHYHPDNERLIKINQFSHDQIRIPFKRRKRKINSLKFIKINSTIELSTLLKQMKSLDSPALESNCSSSSLSEIIMTEENICNEKQGKKISSELDFFSNEKISSEKKIINTMESLKKSKNSLTSLASIKVGINELQDFEKIENYSNYFPEKNITSIMKEFSSLIKLNQNLRERTEWMKKYENLSKYTFYSNYIVEKFFREQEIIRSKKNDLILNVSSPTKLQNNFLPSQFTIVDGKKIASRKRKMTFFKGIPTKKQKIEDFTNLIATLIKKNREEKKKT